MPADRQVQPEAAALPVLAAKRNGCSHHWLIEGAILPLSKGVCQACGEERWFRNQLRWEEIAPVNKLMGRRAARRELAGAAPGATASVAEMRWA